MYDQYDTTDYVAEKDTAPNVKTHRSGMLQEIEISGQKFHAIDPIEFSKLENSINNLKQRLMLTEQLLRQLQSQIRFKDKQINDIKQALDTKVSHET